MQVALHTIAPGDSRALEELNGFLRGHRILTLDREFHAGVWAFCITYQPPAGSRTSESAPKIDYKEILDGKTFALFSKLREVRKVLAEKENLPPYAVFTNEQLAAVARARCTSQAELGKIDGIGSSRIEKFGPPLLVAIREHEKLPSPA